MIESLKRHWREYLMEAAGLAGFVGGASLLTVFLEHPELAVMQSVLGGHPLLRRVPLGIILGAYIGGVVYLLGKRSGAHINPAVTWAFYRLGKINFADAVFYTLAQFAGAIAAAQIMKMALGDFYRDSPIHYVVTEPAKWDHSGAWAFAAEFFISFVLMFTCLIAANSSRLEKLVAPLTGVLIALYLIVETPYSGMSLNPARSFGSALAANEWRYLWIYFVAPPLAMLTAAEIFRLTKSFFGGLIDKEQPSYPNYEEN
ncbi:MAG TPA: aquaporin [Pyrinomonadaceae bacterium]|jgi:aquaporin Z